MGGGYWSSTEFDRNEAWCQIGPEEVGYIAVMTQNKQTDVFNVRAIRAF